MFFVGTGGVFSGDITGCIRIVRFEVIKYAGVMALSASIFKATVRIDDMDRSHYGTYSLTLARHPSETDERMMVRLLAFMCYADERLSFTKGLSETDEPDLWMHDLQGQVALWIETGTPTLRRVVSACRKAERVVVFAYGRSVMQWWRKNGQSRCRLSAGSVDRFYGCPCASYDAVAVSGSGRTNDRHG